MRGDCARFAWGRLDPFHGDEENQNFVWRPSPRIPTHPLAIYLLGDAWGNAWGWYAWVSEAGVSERVQIPYIRECSVILWVGRRILPKLSVQE